MLPKVTVYNTKTLQAIDDLFESISNHRPLLFHGGRPQSSRTDRRDVVTWCGDVTRWSRGPLRRRSGRRAKRATLRLIEVHFFTTAAARRSARALRRTAAREDNFEVESLTSRDNRQHRHNRPDRRRFNSLARTEDGTITGV